MELKNENEKYNALIRPDKADRQKALKLQVDT